jgi:hypothetical protein
MSHHLLLPYDGHLSVWWVSYDLLGILLIDLQALIMPLLEASSRRYCLFIAEDLTKKNF